MTFVRTLAAAAAVITMLGAAATARAQDAATDTTWTTYWAPGSHWVTVGGGYAKNVGKTAGNGLFGGSVSYHYMFWRGWSVDAFVGQELYGKFRSAANIGTPIGATIQRHFEWKTQLRPFLGIGYGVTMQRYFRTGFDTHQTAPTFYVTTGADAPIARGRLLGLVARIGFTKLEEANPVFNPLEIQPDGRALPTWDDTQLWSVQVRYALVL